MRRALPVLVGAPRIAGALVVIALATASPARAQDERGITSTLSWTRLPGAEACPTVVEVGRAVEALLGRSVLVESRDADRIVEASVAPGSEGVPFVAAIQVASRDGEVLGRREIAAHDRGCADLADTAALAIALMIDPDAEVGAERGGDPGAGEGERAIEREIVVVETPAPLGAPTRLAIDLGAAGTLGVGPFASGAGSLRALLGLDGFVPFGVVGVLQPFSRAETTDGDVDFTTVLAGLTICPLYFHGPSGSFGACAGVDLGGTLVVGRTLSAPLAESERFLVQLDVQAYGRIRVWGPLAIQVLAALFVPFRNDVWATTTPTTVWSPTPVAGMLGLGLAIDLVLAGDPEREQHVW